MLVRRTHRQIISGHSNFSTVRLTGVGPVASICQSRSCRVVQSISQTSTKDWETINELLSPVILLVDVGASTFGINLDFWQLINWWFVHQYWGILVDLGQDSVTIYPPTTQLGKGFYPPDFSRPMYYSTNNNIFANNTLFSIYSDILQNQVFHVLNPDYNITSVPSFAPLDNKNRFTPVNSFFRRSYSRVKGSGRHP